MKKFQLGNILIALHKSLTSPTARKLQIKIQYHRHHHANFHHNGGKTNVRFIFHVHQNCSEAIACIISLSG